VNFFYFFYYLPHLGICKLRNVLVNSSVASPKKRATVLFGTPPLKAQNNEICLLPLRL